MSNRARRRWPRITRDTLLVTMGVSSILIAAGLSAAGREFDAFVTAGVALLLAPIPARAGDRIRDRDNGD